MSNKCEFFCVMKNNTCNDVASKDERKEWTTLRWADEFGNSIAPFFTSLKKGQQFLEENSDWQLKRYPVSFVIEAILFDLKHKTSFYTIDPISTEEFKVLSPAQFLTELIYRRHPAETEALESIFAHRDIVPIEVLFCDDSDAGVECRKLVTIADLIFGIDAIGGKQSIVFGRDSLEGLLRTGQSSILAVLNVGLNDQILEIEKLAALVGDIKGHHDYVRRWRGRVESLPWHTLFQSLMRFTRYGQE